MPRPPRSCKRGRPGRLRADDTGLLAEAEDRGGRCGAPAPGADRTAHSPNRRTMDRPSRAPANDARLSSREPRPALRWAGQPASGDLRAAAEARPRVMQTSRPAAGSRRMSIELREEDFDAFFAAPFACYGAAPRRLAMRGDLKRSLDAARNPLFRDLARRIWFTAHRDGSIVGRMLAHIHDAANRQTAPARLLRHARLHRRQDVARALLDAASTLAARARLRRNRRRLQPHHHADDRRGHGRLREPPYTTRTGRRRTSRGCWRPQGFEPFYGLRTFEIDVTRFDPTHRAQRQGGETAGRPGVALHRDRQARLSPTGSRNPATCSTTASPTTRCSCRSPRKNSCSRARE